jgi:hypothetical protein
MLELKGIGRKAIVDNKFVKIKYSIIYGLKREKTIPINQIVSVQVKKAGLLSGYILFQTIGSIDNNILKNAQEVYKDENAVTFQAKSKYLEAIEIKEFIENIQNSSTSNNHISTADEILKFKKLLEDGTITEEEFEKQKKKLIG